MPAPGEVYTAAWGRYVVHRVAADGVVLRDTSRPTACVVPSHDKLARDYRLEAPSPAPIAERRAERTPEAPAAAPRVEPLRSCSECRQVKRVLWATDDDEGPLWCGPCLQTGRPLPPAPSLGTWRPAPGVEDGSSAKSELGSFARPTEPGPARKPAKPSPSRREELRDLWTAATAELDL